MKKSNSDAEKKRSLLKMLPGVDHLLELTKRDEVLEAFPKAVRVSAIRHVLDSLRSGILEENPEIGEPALAEERILEAVGKRAEESMRYRLRRTVNATGVIVHTNLGRSLLAVEALEHSKEIASRYSNLEFDLATGARGSRYANIEEILCEISGAEAAMVVNNNAGAVLLCLNTISEGKKTVVSRGELVEIGGSFRIPDVMAKSGTVLKEVGTTNRTHLRDYEAAIDAETALLLKVHQSNFSIIGFTAEVSLDALVALGEKHRIPVMEDLGSGTFIDFTRYGLTKEPTVQESISAGCDLVTFSGDKLLGGPQAGIIVGRKSMVERVKKNPLTRPLRIDKLTLAALEGTLLLYRDPQQAVERIPTLKMITLPLATIERLAADLARRLETLSPRIRIRILNLSSRAGGGSLPLLELPSRCLGVCIDGVSANAIERGMREHDPPIVGRIENDSFIIDPRTLQEDELRIIETAFRSFLKKGLT